jgi:hypothetical protein
MSRNVFIVSLLALFVTACTTTQDRPVSIERPRLILPKVQPVSQGPVRWIVITKENATEKLKELESRGITTVVVATPAGYRTLNLNIADLRRYIRQQNAVIAAYEKYYNDELKDEQKKP